MFELKFQYRFFYERNGVSLNIIPQFSIKAIVIVVILIELDPHIVEVLAEFMNNLLCNVSAIVIIADIIFVNVNLFTTV